MTHESEELVASGFFEQPCPDEVLACRGKFTEAAEQERLDKDGIDEGAEAEEYRKSLCQKDSVEPRVGMTEGDIDQNRCRSREENEVDIVEHFEVVLIGCVIVDILIW